jgi:hypothetical protein
MCCQVPVKCKAQPMPPSSGFPPGWTFVIDPAMSGYSKDNARKSQTVYVEGLKIMAPNLDREYHSAERAKVHYRLALAYTSPEKFYEYIGAISEFPKAAPKLKSSARYGGARCGACENCTKDACGHCARCKSSNRGASSRCFQKVSRFSVSLHFLLKVVAVS